MTIVFLHPVGLDRDCWKLTDLEGEMYDYPGHGGRPLPSKDEYTLDYIADEVVDTYSGPLDLVGVSMGGAVCQHIGVRHPERVRSLMICCRGATGQKAAASRPAIQDQRAEDTLRFGMAGTLNLYLERWFTKEALTDPSHPGVAYARRRLLTDSKEAIAATWLALRGSTLREQLSEITAPVTILGGRHDQAATVDRVVELFRLMPTARLEIINGPHMLHLERPNDFADAVRRHLEWVIHSL